MHSTWGTIDVNEEDGEEEVSSSNKENIFIWNTLDLKILDPKYTNMTCVSALHYADSIKDEMSFANIIYTKCALLVFPQVYFI